MASIVDLVGRPFVYGARGPEAFDCYGLLIELYRRDGIVLPDYTTPSNEAGDRGSRIISLFGLAMVDWQPVAEGDEHPGDALHIRVPGNHHCGYYLGGDWFAHTWEGSNGVLRERVSLWKNRILGYYRYDG